MADISLILELKTSTNKNEIMAQYDFYQDEKCIIWERIRFTIEAPTQEEAIAKAASLIRGDVIVSSNQDKQIRIEETEFCSILQKLYLWNTIRGILRKKSI